VDYGETSRIVNIFTRDQGRVGVMARGARDARSRFGSTLEPMSWIQAVIHFQPGRELQSLSEASHMEVFANIGRSLDRIGVGVRMIELTGALMQSGQSNPMVLDLQVEALRMANKAEENVANVWPHFAMRLAGVLGLAPAFRREEVAGLPSEGGWLRLDNGEVETHRPAGAPSVRASRAGLRTFAIFTRAAPEVILGMALEPGLLAEVNRLVDAYLHYQVDDAFPSRTARVLGQIGA
jgi:DNA repair protein RecO (recombination protein O)